MRVMHAAKKKRRCTYTRDDLVPNVVSSSVRDVGSLITFVIFSFFLVYLIVSRRDSLDLETSVHCELEKIRKKIEFHGIEIYVKFKIELLNIDY